MATTTPNYGWDVPTSTDYVKDGATAIETLGDDIDASLFSITGGKNVGLQLISTTTVTSSSTAINVNNCFSATYDNYFAVFDITPVSSGTINLRMRNGGTDRTDNAYSYVSQAYNTSGTSVGNYGSGTSGIPTQAYAAYNQVGIFQIQNPFVSTKISEFQSQYNGLSTAGSVINGVSGVRYNTLNSNDGFSIYSSAGNITGKITIYGYAK